MVTDRPNLIAPVPTSQVTFHTTRVITNATLTVPPTFRVEAPRVTLTLHTATAYTFSIPTVTVSTSTSYAQVWKTVATGTFADTVCANGANPTTVTKCKSHVNS